MRILLAFDRFGPYHFARALAAAAHPDITLATLEFHPDNPEYEWDKVKPPEGLLHYRGTRFDELLRDFAPEVVAIPGWSGAAPQRLHKDCLRESVPTIVMSESTAWDFPRKLIKETVKRIRISRFDAGFVGGKAHRDYLQKLGFPPEKVSFGYDVVDNSHFAPLPEGRDRPADVPEKQFFLASARFIEKKNLAGLIRAFSEAVTTWDLVILGDGHLRKEHEELAASLNLGARVHFPGFKQYDELPNYYGAASAFVHASTTEQWGLVVNEALASGLPVIVSDRCGCANELAETTFDPADVSGLARLLTETTLKKHDPQDSLDRIAAWDLNRFAGGLYEAAMFAVAMR